MDKEEIENKMLEACKKADKRHGEPAYETHWVVCAEVAFTLIKEAKRDAIIDYLQNDFELMFDFVKLEDGKIVDHISRVELRKQLTEIIANLKHKQTNQ